MLVSILQLIRIFKKNDKIRMMLVCKEGCNWNAYWVKIPTDETRQLRKIMEKHICSRGFRVKLLILSG
jgi:hypothetical protein